MHNSLISSLARKVDQLQFAAFDEELANEDLVDFTPLPKSEPEEDSGFDFSETEDEEEAAAEDDELSQAAVHGQSAIIDLDEDDELGEALEVFEILRRHFCETSTLLFWTELDRLSSSGLLAKLQLEKCCWPSAPC